MEQCAIRLPGARPSGKALPERESRLAHLQNIGFKVWGYCLTELQRTVMSQNQRIKFLVIVLLFVAMKRAMLVAMTPGCREFAVRSHPCSWVSTKLVLVHQLFRACVLPYCAICQFVRLIWKQQDVAVFLKLIACLVRFQLMFTLGLTHDEYEGCNF